MARKTRSHLTGMLKRLHYHSKRIYTLNHTGQGWQVMVRQKGSGLSTISGVGTAGETYYVLFALCQYAEAEKRKPS